MVEAGAPPVEVIRAAVLEGTAHGFLGRIGGVSTGEVAGLNVGLGSGDDRQAIAENRRRAAAAVMPGAPLVTVYQVHSPDCVVADRPWPNPAWEEAERPHADALVTNRPGLLLGILTADCARGSHFQHRRGDDRARRRLRADRGCDRPMHRPGQLRS